MPDTNISVIDSLGNPQNIAERLVGLNNRGVLVVGDPSIADGVAFVRAADPLTNDAGLVVRDVNSSAIVTRLGQTLSVQFSPSTPSVSVASFTGSVGVYFDRGNPSVNVSNGTVNVFLPDTGHEIGTIRGNTNTLTVFLPDTGHELGSIRQINTTVTVQFDPGHELGSIRGNSNTLTVFLPDTGHELGSIRGNTNTLTVFLPDTGHELGSIRGINSTLSVSFDRGYPAVNIYATAVLSNAGGITSTTNSSAVSVSGATILSPDASHSFKVYAYGLSTTAQSNILVKFTNGAGTSPTEYMRYALQAPTAGISGANLAVTPPGFLFQTGVNSTLSLVTDSASLVHAWVAYFKEATA